MNILYAVSYRQIRVRKFLFCFLMLAGFAGVVSAAPINAYAKVTAISGKVMMLSNINQTYHVFAAGEQVILIQMQDNVIGSNTANNSSFGAISSIGSAGLYYVYLIGSVSGPTMTLTTTPDASFNPSGSLQVVSFNSMGTNFSTTSSITAVSWDGNAGGVVALQMSGTLTVNNSINADGAGFRGGVASANYALSCEPAVYMSTSTHYAYKGEGIQSATYDYYTARAPLASGGGGGSDNNGGGGGGSNFTAGGTGGPGYNCSVANASGGVGGVSLSSHITGDRVFMGGGGGGGQQNGSAGTAGGNGGGIVFISANKITTTCIFNIMNITAEGSSAGNSGSDGAGGAGAGGTVVLAVNNFAAGGLCPLNISPDGGDGGDVNNFTAYGGGGGGGQGALVFTASLPTSSVYTSTDNGNGGANSYFGTDAGDGVGTNNVGILPGTAILLPVDFISFTVTTNGEADALHWTTAQGPQTAQFTVQRSADGIQFSDIGTVTGDAAAYTGGDYSFVDGEPLAGKNFYRVKETDAGGEVRYTATAIINRVDAAGNFQIYPNPAHGAFTIQLRDATSGPVSVSIDDLSGATVYRGVGTATNGRVNVPGIGSVTAGVYLIRVETKDGVQTGKLILR